MDHPVAGVIRNDGGMRLLPWQQQKRVDVMRRPVLARRGVALERMAVNVNRMRERRVVAHAKHIGAVALEDCERRRQPRITVIGPRLVIDGPEIFLAHAELRHVRAGNALERGKTASGVATFKHKIEHGRTSNARFGNARGAQRRGIEIIRPARCA